MRCVSKYYKIAQLPLEDRTRDFSIRSPTSYHPTLELSKPAAIVVGSKMFSVFNYKELRSNWSTYCLSPLHSFSDWSPNPALVAYLRVGLKIYHITMTTARYAKYYVEAN